MVQPTQRGSFHNTHKGKSIKHFRKNIFSTSPIENKIVLSYLADENITFTIPRE